MPKKLSLVVVLVLTLVFLLSVGMTLVSAGKPGGCLRCGKGQLPACPAGHCYFDCQGCCWEDPLSHQIYCLR